MELDRLDIRVMRELLQGQYVYPLNPDFRGSYRKIARKVGAGKDVVRNRIARLHEDLIDEWHLFINPNLLGLDTLAVWLDVPPSVPKGPLLEKLKLMERIFLILNFFGSKLGVVMLCESETAARKRVELIARISDAAHVSQGKVPSPECRMRLARTDWDIIRVLHRNLRMPYEDIGVELGISSRTVKRKLQRMTKETVLFGMPALQFGRLKGTILAALFVSYPGELKADLDRRIFVKTDDYLWHVLHTVPLEAGRDFTTIFDLAVPSLSTAQRIAESVGGVKGVTGARVEAYEDCITLFENFPRKT